MSCRTRTKTVNTMKLHLLILCLLVCVFAYTSSSPILCRDIERSALLEFKKSFYIHCSHSVNPSANPKTLSWNMTDNGKSDCCGWDGVECDPRTGHVLGLDLSSSCLYGSMSSNSTLFDLVHLQSLNLSDNDFRYSHIPSRLGRLRDLKYLNLSQSSISGQVPIEVSTLSNLVSLDLSLNIEPLSGSQLLEIQPPSLAMLLANLTSLEILSLSDVNISFPVPEMIVKLTSLKSLRLENCGLYGTFPQIMFQLPELQVLHLANNIYLTGSFPEFQRNNKLKRLSVQNTGFYGLIPTSISNLSSIEMLSIQQCDFQGSIPNSIAVLSRLTYLDLSSNNMSGKIPHSIRNLTELSYLRLSYNSFEGEVPNLSNLTKLFNIELSHNLLRGSIGGFLSGLENIEFLFLSNNYFSPLEFDKLYTNKNLQVLSLSNIDLIFSTNSHNQSRHPQFVALDLTSCNMIRFPSFIYNQTRISLLQLTNNSIQGSLPIPPSPLVVYDMVANGFSGEIPTAICNATSLKILHLGVNMLRGRIPPCLFNHSNHLESLDLKHNDLHGTIPEALTSSCTLKWFDLSQNEMEGALPRSLVNCSSLEMLALDHNNMVDTFPTWLSGIPGLQAIFLQSNNLHGPLPLKFGVSFPKLYWIVLSDNHFTGTMSNEFFENLYAIEKLSPRQNELTVFIDVFGTEIHIAYSYLHPCGKYQDLQLGSKFLLMAIDLSNNHLVGEVPSSIGNLNGLQILDLSGNNLTGGIPLSFGNLTNLLGLDLSHNRLSGEIPQQLNQLSFLAQFDVSYNQLTGPIPQGQQFSTFDNVSFIGNTGLCGSPLSKKCGKTEVKAPHYPSSEEHEDATDVIGWLIRSMGYISGLVVGVILGRMITDTKHQWFVQTFGKEQKKRLKRRAR